MCSRPVGELRQPTEPATEFVGFFADPESVASSWNGVIGEDVRAQSLFDAPRTCDLAMKRTSVRTVVRDYHTYSGMCRKRIVKSESARAPRTHNSSSLARR